MHKGIRRMILSCFISSALICLAGCLPLDVKRDFKQIYAPYLDNIDDNPVIIIPGIIGSRLAQRDSGKIIWGSIRAKEVLFLSDRSEIALPIDNVPLVENKDDVVSKGIIDQYDLPTGIIEFKVYIDLLDMFEEIGYKFGDISNPQPGDNLFIFDYDWRRDNVENAEILDRRITGIKKAFGKKNTKFTLVCHSMGGLLARYYAQYGGEDVLDQAPDFKVTWKGAQNIKRMILIAIPNLGCMPVFKFMHEGLNLLIVEYPPYVLFTMPSLYQLLPSRQVRSFIDEEGNELGIDLYDPENWKKYGWSIYSEKMVTHVKSRYRLKHKADWKERLKSFEYKRDRFVKAALERADLFQKSLGFKPAKKPPCEIVVFGGDTEWTLDKAILKKEKNGYWRTSFWDPRLQEKLLKPGDGMVTRDSLLGVSAAGTGVRTWEQSPMDLSFCVFVSQRHENIHKDSTFKDNLLHILLVE